MTLPPRAHELDVIGCRTCGQVCRPASMQSPGAPCPRCGAPLHARHPGSISQAWALLLAGMICYIPANALPVMHTASLGGTGSDTTILRGVIEFWNSGSYGIALVIFTASVAIPCSKFIALGLLVVTAQRRSGWAMLQRARLYRLIERIGHWSMLDVTVVAIAAALVKFAALADIEPRIGILFFGLTVILTMLGTMAFDPRLIWDGGTG